METLKYELSYPVDTVAWDGTFTRKGNQADFEAELEVLKRCGITEVMLSGFTDVEPADFDLSEYADTIGNILRINGMSAAQHHGNAATFTHLTDSQDGVVEKLKRSIDYTAALNAAVLVIHPGRIDEHFVTAEEYHAAYEAEEEKYGLESLIDECAKN